MPTYEQIKTKIQHLSNASKFLAKKELKELPNILWEDEDVEKLIQGLYGKGTGVLVATSKRLIFVDKGFLGGLRVEDFPYDKISTIQYETGLLFGKLTIFTSGNRAVIEQVDKKETREFGDYVRARITKPTVQEVKPVTDTASTGDHISQLERLAKLKENGVLTEQEFQDQKKKILG